MTYDKEFEEMIKRVLGVCTVDEKKMVYLGWTEARKDHYRIGEEVESYGSDGWKLSVITATREGIGFTENPEFVRKIPAKSRIDEIAEEAEDKYRRGSVGAGSLTDIIKSAILRALEEKEANR